MIHPYRDEVNQTFRRSWQRKITKQSQIKMIQSSSLNYHENTNLREYWLYKNITPLVK